MVNIAAGDAMHVVGGASNAGSASIRIRIAAAKNPTTPAQTTMPGRRQHDDADDRRERARAAHDMRPDAAFQPPGDGEQQERGRDLPDIERGQRGAHQIRPPDVVQIVGQECVGGEIHRVGAAERDAEPPDQRVAPVRPPALRGRVAWARAAGRGASSHDDERDQRDRHRPDHEARAPAVAERAAAAAEWSARRAGFRRPAGHW